jgi:hypothetical protein
MSVRTTTHVEYLVDVVTADGRYERVSYPGGQVSTPEEAEQRVRSFCRPGHEWPLTLVKCRGTRTTVTTLFT